MLSLPVGMHECLVPVTKVIPRTWLQHILRRKKKTKPGIRNDGWIEIEDRDGKRWITWCSNRDYHDRVECRERAHAICIQDNKIDFVCDWVITCWDRYGVEREEIINKIIRRLNIIFEV